MEHTKKFVLVDPRFVRPTMRDKVLSELDSGISNILNSDDSDEIKAKNYISALARFRNLSAPAKPEKTTPVPPLPPPVASVAYKTARPPKRPHKRVKIETVASDDPSTAPSLDSSFWRRTLRTPSKKNLGKQWLTYKESPLKKKKSRKTWVTQ